MPHSTARRVAALLALTALAGCAAPTRSGGGAPAPPSAVRTSTTATPAPVGTAPITVVRTGGLAGVRETLVVWPDGRWRWSGTAGRAAGRLTGAELEQVRRLAADPRLAEEARRAPGPSRCGDAFSYSLAVGATAVRYVDCPGEPGQPAAASALVRMLAGATR